MRRGGGQWPNKIRTEDQVREMQKERRDHAGGPDARPAGRAAHPQDDRVGEAREGGTAEWVPTSQLGSPEAAAGRGRETAVGVRVGGGSGTAETAADTAETADDGDGEWREEATFGWSDAESCAVAGSQHACASVGPVLAEPA